MKEDKTLGQEIGELVDNVLSFLAVIPIFLSIGLILFQIFIWLKIGAWPEWPIHYAFVNKEISLEEVYTKGFNEKLSLEDIDKEIQAAEYVLDITPSRFQYFSKDSWVESPTSWFGLHKAVKWVLSTSIPTMSFLLGIPILFFYIFMEECFKDWFG